MTTKKLFLTVATIATLSCNVRLDVLYPLAPPPRTCNLAEPLADTIRDPRAGITRFDQFKRRLTHRGFCRIFETQYATAQQTGYSAITVANNNKIYVFRNDRFSFTANMPDQQNRTALTIVPCLDNRICLYALNWNQEGTRHLLEAKLNVYDIESRTSNPLVTISLQRAPGENGETIDVLRENAYRMYSPFIIEDATGGGITVFARRSLSREACDQTVWTHAYTFRIREESEQYFIRTSRVLTELYRACPCAEGYIDRCENERNPD
ncbi:hypothetical protein HY990_03740 [Candidatus Micrarchaeota archaeon]|nr:hypothetical protein [Candidatus Micrarchaeota archaeon]